jgi:hypothetical protein
MPAYRGINLRSGDLAEQLGVLYGDRYPVTTEGRVIAAVLMTAGVGLFGTFTAFVASWFVAEKKTD